MKNNSAYLSKRVVQVHLRILLALLLFAASACDRSYTPKPSGYIRVDYPEKAYRTSELDIPVRFEYPEYCELIRDPREHAEQDWYDLNFPDFNGTLHLSYKKVNGNLEDYIADSRSLVYKHASRSDGIVEVPFVDPDNRRFGILYELDGDVASSVQFFLTDSTRHFLRGSLYFSTTPNSDSLRPIVAFVKTDIEHLIETVQWESF